MEDPRSKPKSLNLFISCGEVSADKYSSQIIKILKEKSLEQGINLYAWGMAGQMSAEQGVELIQDSTKLGVIGAADILKNLWFFYKLEKRLIEEIKKNKPNVALLVDYPGLNLRLAKQIKKHVPHCKIIFFIAPQVWAWNHSRINKLPAIVDRLLTILPFEEEMHKEAGTSTRYVGNPSAHFINNYPEVEREEFFKYLGLDTNKKTIGIFPGSRSREIQYMLPVFLEAAKDLANKRADIQFALVRANSIEKEIIEEYLKKHNCSETLIKIVEPDHNYQTLQTVDIAWQKSGTTTLEAACSLTPLILGYREFPLFWKVYLFVRRLNRIGLPNIIAGEKENVCPELLQDECIPENWVGITQEWLDKESFLESKKQELKDKILDKLVHDSSNPFENVAEEIIYANQISHLGVMNKFYIKQRAEENSRDTAYRNKTRPKFIT